MYCAQWLLLCEVVTLFVFSVVSKTDESLTFVGYREAV